MTKGVRPVVTYYGIHLPETNGRPVEYDLMGGVVSAVQIYRNASCGEGIFKADGGTFQLRAAITPAASFSRLGEIRRRFERIRS